MNTIYRIILSFLILTSILSVNSFAQTNLAVLELEPKNISTVAAEALSDRLRDELVVLDKFKVIARDVMMNRLLEEQSLQLSGCTSTECIVQAGNILGAEKVVGGSVSKVEGVYFVSVKIVDVETGQIVKAVPYDFDGDISDLLTKGMKEIAYKLSDVVLPSKTNTAADTVNSVSNFKQSSPPFKSSYNYKPPKKVRFKLVSQFGLVFHDDLGEGKVTDSQGYGFSLDFGLGQGFTLGPELFYSKLTVDDISDIDSSYARYHDQSSLLMAGLVGKLSLYESATSMKTTFSVGFAELEYNYRTERQPGLFGDQQITTKGSMYIGFGAYFELLASSPINLYAQLDYAYIFPPGYETKYSFGEENDNNDTIKLYRLIVGISLTDFSR